MEFIVDIVTWGMFICHSGSTERLGNGAAAFRILRAFLKDGMIARTGYLGYLSWMNELSFYVHPRDLGSLLYSHYEATQQQVAVCVCTSTFILTFVLGE